MNRATDPRTGGRKGKRDGKRRKGRERGRRNGRGREGEGKTTVVHVMIVNLPDDRGLRDDWQKPWLKQNQLLEGGGVHLRTTKVPLQPHE